MTRPWRLKEMTPADARDRLRQTGRLILPAGTLELRGAHLPLGCDTLILERLADDLSARTGVPRAPAIEFGVHAGGDESGPGAAALSRKTLHRVMNELIAAWEEGAGVREVIILTAHAADAHQEALSTIRAVGEVRVVDIFGFDFSGLLEHPDDRLHGGELDTSLMLFLHPELMEDAAAIARVHATADQGRRLHDFILARITETCFGSAMA
jgi:creatinine amidohydrolase